MRMWSKRLTAATVAALLVTAGSAACDASPPGRGEAAPPQQSPQRGGTLNMLGSGDVGMDVNTSYYSIGYLVHRLWSRQLYAYPGDGRDSTRAVPDLATGPADVSADGLTVTVTIRPGAQWNTSPPRQVTASDLVRGVKRTCNPAQPFGGLPNYIDLLVGFADFCAGFARVRQRADAIAEYINSTELAGVKEGSDPLTVVFALTHAATYFPDMLTLTAFSPAPKEYDAYVPASAELAQHTISDGPYRIESYKPTKRIVLSRNPAWKAETDPVRKAYVDKIVIDETVSQESTQQQLETGTPKADMELDNFPPPSQLPALIRARDPRLHLGTTDSSNPLLVFNLRSPNNAGAMQKLPFRQALMHSINRDHLIQDHGGPKVNPPLTHVLPQGIVGGAENFDLYPHDVTKAAQLLSEAETDNVELKVLYDPSDEGWKKNFATLQQDLKHVGIAVAGVPAPTAAIISKYLPVPSVAQRGVWDLAISGWAPDWFGNAALSYFKPLFNGKAAFPPNGSNFGFYDSARVQALIAEASVAESEDEAAQLWHQADEQVMKDAAFFPVSSRLQPNYHAAHVRNARYIPAIQNFDPTNVWLEPNVNGG
jgi:peptide/nickel transport system substrate-binding protein